MDTVADVELEQLHVSEGTGSVGTKQQHHVRFQEEDVRLSIEQPSAFNDASATTEKCVCNTDKSWFYTVTIQGNRAKPAIVTLHDIGLDAELCFGGFFNYPEMTQLRQHFCVYHLTVMGQEPNAPKLADDAAYPSLADLADMLGSFCGQYRIEYFVGIAVGVGANIMARFAYQEKNMINALCLVNCISTAAGWSEWSSQTVGGWMNSILWRRDQKSQQIEYLMWHYFGRNMERFPDIINFYRTHFTQRVEANNLSKFLDSYAHRTDIGISREQLPAGAESKALGISAPTLLVAAQGSPHYDDTVAMNARMRPDKTEFMQVDGADGAVLEEFPDKVAQALVLHLQGCGFVSQFFRRRRFSDRGDY